MKSKEEILHENLKGIYDHPDEFEERLGNVLQEIYKAMQSYADQQKGLRWGKASETELPSVYGDKGRTILNVKFKGMPDIIKFNGIEWVWYYLKLPIKAEHWKDIEWLDESLTTPACQCERYREVLNKFLNVVNRSPAALYHYGEVIKEAEALLDTDAGKEDDINELMPETKAALKVLAEKHKPKDSVQKIVSDLIFDAAISKAIEDKRELLKPSIQHFLSGGNVNGEFGIAVKKLMRWVENKTIEAALHHRK